MKKQSQPVRAFCSPLVAHDFTKPLHHFDLKIGKRSIHVTTDFALTGKNSKAYSTELTAFIAGVEAAWARRRAAPKTLGALPAYRY